MTPPRKGAVDGECRRNRRDQAAEPLLAGALLVLEDVSDFDVEDEDEGDPLLSLLVLALVPFEELPPLSVLELLDPLRESVR